MRKHLTLLVVLLLVGLGIFLSSSKKKEEVFSPAPSSPQASSAAATPKVLVLGIDGADPVVLGTLMKQGKLPHFQKLANDGFFGPLQTILPAQSPVAWTSIATGCNPGKHNLFDFIRRKPGSYTPLLSLAKPKQGLVGSHYESYVKADPFFVLTSQAGIPTSVIEFPMTFPPPRVEGNLLSGMGVPDIKGLLSSYAVYTNEPDFQPEKAKLQRVSIEAGRIQTVLAGPRERKSGKPVDVTIPFEIRVASDHVELLISEQKHTVSLQGWSDWLELEFSAGLLGSVHGIAKAYLHSIDPFRLYLTSVQIHPKHPLYPISHPEKYSGELADEIGLYSTLSIKEDTTALNDGSLNDKSFLEQTAQLEEERDKMFWSTFGKFDSGLLVFVYDTSDRVAHMFWDHKVLHSDTLTIHPAIEKYYLEKDAFLGKVLAQLDLDTKLMIVSDHGFTSFERSVNINSWLVENDYMTLSEPATKERAGELFTLVDWSQTKAYSLGFGSIYLNLEGREPEGIVSKTDYDNVVAQLSKDLLTMRDPELKRPVMHRVHSLPQMYNGPYTSDGPDLVIGLMPGYRAGWEGAIGGVTPQIISDNTKHWRGDHIVDPSFVPGILFANFQIEKENPSQLDIAPTVLALFGLEAPVQMDGEALISSAP